MASVADSTSPFVSIPAAAQFLGISVGAVRQRVTTGTLVAYQLGRTWFIPAEELHRTSPWGRERWTRADAETVAALTDALPDHLTIEDLERFFGLRRPRVFDVLRAPGLSSSRNDRYVTTKELLARALRDARRPLRVDEDFVDRSPVAFAVAVDGNAPAR